MELFLEPLGVGAVLLLTILLGTSTVLALYHARNLRTDKQYLVVDHKARGIDFVSSQVGYYMSLAAGVVLIPTLSYQFGPLALLFVALYFVSAVVTFNLLLRKSKTLRSYLENDFGLPRFISGNMLHSKGKVLVEASVAMIMLLVYWGLFAIEIVVLKKIIGVLFPVTSTTAVVFVTSLLVVIYASLGGYLSTMRTDGLQTGFLIMAVILFTCTAMPSDIFNILFSTRIFEIRPDVAKGDVIGLGITALLLGAGYLMAQQDAWSRVSAISKRSGVDKAPLYLFLCLLAIIPSLAIGLWGLYEYSVEPNLIAQSDIEAIPASIITRFSGIAPIGLLIPAYVAVCISTADTALLTCAQVIASFRERWLDSLRKCRVFTAILGLLGILVAFVSPSAVDAIFSLGSIPLVFIPVIIGRIFYKRQAPWAVFLVFCWGVAMGVAILVIGGEFRNVAPIILFLVAIILYPTFEWIAQKWSKK